MSMYKNIIFCVLALGLAAILSPGEIQSPIRSSAVLGADVSTETNTDTNSSPELAASSRPLELSARAALAYDLGSGAMLFGKNFDEQLPIASLTKLATALTAVEFIDSDDVASIKESDVKIVGSNMGLLPMEKIKALDLLKAMLISSSNDAATALARFVAGSEEKFVEMMNRKAESLGMSSSHFSNPVGWDDARNYSTASDLMLLAEEISENPVLSEIVGIKELEIKSTDGRITHKIKTTNKLLLEDPKVVGMKTGFTSAAKGNLMIRARTGNADIITVVLGSDNREEDTRNLLNWIWSSYKW